MIWNYVETARLVSLHVSLHVVFQNLVALVIASDKTMWGYRELQVSRKLEHGLRHYSNKRRQTRIISVITATSLATSGITTISLTKDQHKLEG